MQTVQRAIKRGRPWKLTEQQKDLVVNHYNHGDTQKKIADMFNVSLSTIRRVLQERR